MRLLDLFCGAGGCSVGYARAGFEVTGVDIEPRHHYPFFDLVQDDALAVLADAEYLRGFDAIHASPPCQAYTSLRTLHDIRHPELIEPVRDRLEATGLPYVIENVVGAPLRAPVMLCGQTFGLGVFRHRLFETNWPLTGPRHEAHAGQVGDGRYFTVTGHGGGSSTRDALELGSKEDWQTAMGIDWMSKGEIAQAIPPAYTEFIGRQLIAHMARPHARDTGEDPRAWGRSDGSGEPLGGHLGGLGEPLGLELELGREPLGGRGLAVRHLGRLSGRAQASSYLRP